MDVQQSTLNTQANQAQRQPRPGAVPESGINRASHLKLILICAVAVAVAAIIVIMLAGAHLPGLWSGPRAAQAAVGQDAYTLALVRMSDPSSNPLLSYQDPSALNALISLSSNTSPSLAYSLLAGGLSSDAARTIGMYMPSSSPLTGILSSGDWNSTDTFGRCVFIMTIFHPLGLVGFKPGFAFVNGTWSSNETTNLIDGCSSQSNIQSLEEYSPAPMNVSDGVSLYETAYAYEYILFVAEALGRMYSIGAFGPVTNVTPLSTIGVGSYLPISTYYTGAAEQEAMTSSSPEDSAYTYGASSIVPGWLELLGGIDSPVLLGAMHGITTSTNGKSLTPSQFFYAMSFVQHTGMHLDAVMYDDAVSPEIAFMYYAEGSLLIDAGNIDPTGAVRPSLRIDGNNVNYTQYYDFLIVNSSLSIGTHSVSMSYDGTTSTRHLHVAPLVAAEAYSHRNTATFVLTNPTNDTINVSSITVHSRATLTGESPISVGDLHIGASGYGYYWNSSNNYSGGSIDAGNGAKYDFSMPPMTFRDINFTFIGGCAQIGEYIGFNVSISTNLGFSNFSVPRLLCT